MSVTRKSKVVVVGDTATTVLNASTGENLSIVSLLVGNVDGANSATIDITITKSGNSAIDIVKGVPIAAGEIVEIVSGGNSAIFLESGDILAITASAADDIVATVSYIREA